MSTTLLSQLTITLGALGLELAIFALLLVQSRRPPIAGKVRLFPYGPMMIFMVVLFLVTAAHLVSLYTGTQLLPRRPKGM